MATFNNSFADNFDIHNLLSDREFQVWAPAHIKEARKAERLVVKALKDQAASQTENIDINPPTSAAQNQAVSLASMSSSPTGKGSEEPIVEVRCGLEEFRTRLQEEHELMDSIERAESFLENLLFSDKDDEPPSKK